MGYRAFATLAVFVMFGGVLAAEALPLAVVGTELEWKLREAGGLPALMGVVLVAAVWGQSGESGCWRRVCEAAGLWSGSDGGMQLH